MKLNELEYKALNIMDIVSTVEIAFQPSTSTIHIFDTNFAVEPEYNFAKKTFELSEGFYKMADVIAQKGYFPLQTDETMTHWIKRIEWRFYSSKQTIKTYKNNEMVVCVASNLKDILDEELIIQNYYPRYVRKLLF